MSKICVIGAGAMGLSAAYHALRRGHEVIVVEADTCAGGMAAHFDFGGLSIERFYHFICKADRPLIALMSELGISQKLKWRPTSMGYFIHGQHHPFGDPISLLKMPGISLSTKIRYGAQMFVATKRRDWTKLEGRTARDWIEKGAGTQAYEVLWRRLLELKFHHFADDISAPWLWSRIKRVGTSRRSIFQEELGYVEGGSQVLVDALVGKITELGGKVVLNTPVRRVAIEDGRATLVETGDHSIDCDHVVSTVPTPYVNALIPGLPEALKKQYAAIKNIAVVCLVIKLRRPLGRHFWLNINDDRFEIPGLVEYSNLRPLPDPIVYVPYYLPPEHEKFGRSDDAFISETIGYLKILNPALGEGDVVDVAVGRLRHAQPVCEAGFASKLPPIETPILGLQIADTCFYYPEDRGFSESVRLGAEMALNIGR